MKNLPLFSWFFFAGAVVLVIGVIWDVSVWFRGRFSASAGIKGFFKTVFSRQIVTLIKSFAVDVFFQKRLWDRDKLRWLMKELIRRNYGKRNQVRKFRARRVRDYRW
jgi:hypothetical protein